MGWLLIRLVLPRTRGNSARGLAARRNTRIDGWRCFAVLGVMWHHWAPREWKGPFPFEIGLFFFLTLTGFLITRILLLEEQRGFRGYGMFLRRRIGRVWWPCTVAMVFAVLVGAHDIRQNPAWYFLHGSNLWMAVHEAWPSGTAPFWTLALQMQFYTVWPVVVWALPSRWLPWIFASGWIIAPVSRLVVAHWFPAVHHAEALPPCAMDYFGAGGLLAWLLHRGVSAGNRRIVAVGWVGFFGYVALYAAREAGLDCGPIGAFQQSFLSLALCGLIAASLEGRGPQWLIHPAVQHVGRLSYGLYLFHALVPLFLGWVLPWLWWEPGTGWLLGVRLVVFALFSWAFAWASWRWLEAGIRLSPPTREPVRGTQ